MGQRKKARVSDDEQIEETEHQMSLYEVPYPKFTIFSLFNSQLRTGLLINMFFSLLILIKVLQFIFSFHLLLFIMAMFIYCELVVILRWEIDRILMF